MLRLGFRHRPTIRFAFSPLWESVASLRALRTAELAHVAERLDNAANVSPAEFALFADLVRGGGEYVPDFLTPPPLTREPEHFDDELHRLAGIPEEEIRRQLLDAAAVRSGRQPRLRAPVDDPEGVTDIVGRCYEAYWTHVLAPEWSRFREMLEADVLVHARRLAFDGGVEAVADGIGPRVAGADRTVLIRCDTVEFECDTDAEDVVFVPSVFSWPKTFIDPGSASQTAVVYYPARGAGRVQGETAEPIADDRLARVVGATCASVLRGLADPITTTDLATRLGLSPSAVSHHLSRLHAAGLTRRTRIGRRVYYERSHRGEELISLFRSEDAEH